MAEQFYTILTKLGKAKIANASALGTSVNFTKFQVGDSNGSYYNPTEDQAELKHKVWEGNIGSVTIDKDNSNWIVIETVIPADQGGFMIREAGIIDDQGNLIAIGKYPETYKPITSEGSSKDLIIRMILEVSNASSVTLKVDPTVILATKKDIDVLDNKIKSIQIPVKSVNTKTGDIVLKAEDIKMANGKTIEERVTSHEADDVNHISYAVATGSANTYAVTLNPVPTAYVDGMAICVKINVASTGASTLNVNGLGAKTILDSLGNAITSGGLKAGVPYTLRYNGTNFIVQGKGGGGNSTADKLLSGYIATVDTGQITGTMPNRTFTANNNNYINAVSTKADGAGSLCIVPLEGYYKQETNGAGFGPILVWEPNLIAPNILNGKSILGIQGTATPLVLTAGDNTLLAETSSDTCGSNSPLQVREMRINNLGGTIRVKFDLASGATGATVYAQIYKNNVAVGTLRSNSSYNSYITYSDDITVNAGDRIELYSYTSNSSAPALTRNLGIYTGYLFPTATILK